MGNSNQPKHKFLFNVDILIEEESNGRALEALLRILNTSPIEDYNVKEGIELGKKIEYALKEAISKRSKPAQDVSEADSKRQIWDQLSGYQANNTLVRLSVVKGKGIKLSMPCRIINVDPTNGNLSVYHDDEKKVYLLNINEIDDYAIG